MEKKTTAVIILNYNNYEDTINCINSVEAYNTAPIKYIVIDNGSQRKGVVETLDKYMSTKFGNHYLKISDDNDITELPYATLLASQTNDGYACGNNKGLALAYSDDSIKSILILNNDILFVENIIPTLLDYYYNKLDHCAILSPMLYKKGMEQIDQTCARHNLRWQQIVYNYLFMFFDPFRLRAKWYKSQKMLMANPALVNKDYFEITLPSGSCMLIDKTLFMNIGGFDPNTFLYYEEDILYKKIEQLGLSNYLIPHLKCIHLGASSTKK